MTPTVWWNSESRGASCSASCASTSASARRLRGGEDAGAAVDARGASDDDRSSARSHRRARPRQNSPKRPQACRRTASAPARRRHHRGSAAPRCARAPAKSPVRRSISARLGDWARRAGSGSADGGGERALVGIGRRRGSALHPRADRRAGSGCRPRRWTGPAPPAASAAARRRPQPERRSAQASASPLAI